MPGAVGIPTAPARLVRSSGVSGSALHSLDGKAIRRRAGKDEDGMGLGNGIYLEKHGNADATGRKVILIGGY
jgi:hypothetical protein